MSNKPIWLQHVCPGFSLSLVSLHSTLSSVLANQAGIRQALFRAGLGYPWPAVERKHDHGLFFFSKQVPR